jgi:glycosyltransferase involved in cell wall biosynthesis
VTASLLSGNATYCLLVPHYNHHEQLARFLPGLIAAGLPILIVDDGSCAKSVVALKAMTANHDGVELLLLAENSGKGVAVMEGIARAAELGYSHAVQIDADGQHCAADISKLLAASSQNPAALVSGLPLFGDDIPLARLRGRKLSLWLVRFETLSMSIEDAMCGFRVYPCAAMLSLHRRWPVGSRMQFDLEVLVRWIWAGKPIHFVPTAVQYPVQGLSHFRMVADNLRIGFMHARLIVGMLLLAPWLLIRKLPQI